MLGVLIVGCGEPEPGPIRKTLRRIRKLVVRTIVVVVALVLSYLLAALTLGLIPANGDYTPPERGIEIFVVSNGVHTGFAVPLRSRTKNWTGFGSLVDDPASAAAALFVEFGWGDRALYLSTPSWSELTLSTALNAIFVPSGAAMHVTHIPKTPQVSGRVKRLVLTVEQYEKLVEFIAGSFAVDNRGRNRHIAGSGYRKLDTFFEATGSYHLFHTCNDWTNVGLKRIGVRTATWSPFDTGILYQLSKVN